MICLTCEQTVDDNDVYFCQSPALCYDAQQPMCENCHVNHRESGCPLCDYYDDVDAG